MPRKTAKKTAPPSKPKPPRILRLRYVGEDTIRPRLQDGTHWTWRPGARIVVDSATWEALSALPEVAAAIAARHIVE